MNFESGDTVRLKASLKRGEMYGWLPLLRVMDIRPNRLKVLTVDNRDRTAFCKLESDINAPGLWYSFDMLDKRTLRKSIK